MSSRHNANSSRNYSGHNDNDKNTKETQNANEDEEDKYRRIVERTMASLAHENGSRNSSTNGLGYAGRPLAVEQGCDSPSATTPSGLDYTIPTAQVPKAPSIDSLQVLLPPSNNYARHPLQGPSSDHAPAVPQTSHDTQNNAREGKYQRIIERTMASLASNNGATANDSISPSNYHANRLGDGENQSAMTHNLPENIAGRHARKQSQESQSQNVEPVNTCVQASDQSGPDNNALFTILQDLSRVPATPTPQVSTDLLSGIQLLLQLLPLLQNLQNTSTQNPLEPLLLMLPVLQQFALPHNNQNLAQNPLFLIPAIFQLLSSSSSQTFHNPSAPGGVALPNLLSLLLPSTLQPAHPQEEPHGESEPTLLLQNLLNQSPAPTVIPEESSMEPPPAQHNSPASAEELPHDEIMLDTTSGEEQSEADLKNLLEMASLVMGKPITTTADSSHETAAANELPVLGVGNASSSGSTLGTATESSEPASTTTAAAENTRTFFRSTLPADEGLEHPSPSASTQPSYNSISASTVAAVEGSESTSQSMSSNIAASSAITSRPNSSSSTQSTTTQQPARTTSTTSGTTPSSSNKAGIPIYMDFDEEALTEYQCLLRKQMELFEATLEDVQAGAQGRNAPVSIGQVGIRCRHCASLPVKARPRGATYFSRTIGGVYQVGQNMAKLHFCKTCQTIPPDIRAKLQYLQAVNRRASGGKEYWSQGLRVLGVYEDGDGMRLRGAQSSRS